jgi:hypothetical protein
MAFTASTNVHPTDVFIKKLAQWPDRGNRSPNKEEARKVWHENLPASARQRISAPFLSSQFLADVPVHCPPEKTNGREKDENRFQSNPPNIGNDSSSQDDFPPSNTLCKINPDKLASGKP